MKIFWKQIENINGNENKKVNSRDYCFSLVSKETKNIIILKIITKYSTKTNSI